VAQHDTVCSVAAGWLETFEGYYQDKVQYILGNVTASMAANSSRVFNWAETSFLKRWFVVHR